MSAGGLSYSGLTSYGKATLPSVSSWGTNNNILKDPPKGVYTRRIDKVGQTSDITRLIDSSGDRACEAILQFPRGVNPMVGVSYNNYGNAGTSGNPTSRSNQTQASLPYRIEVFRPPILRQENTLPLSRLPRNVTSFGTNPSEVDFTKRLMCPDQISFHDPEPVTNSQFRQIVSQPLHTPVRPTAVYNYEEPIKEPFEVKYVIQNPLIVSASSGMRTMDISQQEVKVPKGNITSHDSYGMGTQIAFEGQYRNMNNEVDTGRYLQDGNYSAVTSNLGRPMTTSISDIGEVDTGRYLQDGNYSAVTSNLGRPMTTPISDIGEVDTGRYLQDGNYSSHTSALSGYEENNYIHSDMNLEGKTPAYSMSTNINDDKIYVRNIPENMPELERNIPMGNMNTNFSDRGENQVSSRTYSLPDRPNYGSFANEGFRPGMERQDQKTTLNSQKANLSHRVMNQMMGRSSVPGSSMVKNRIPQNQIGPRGPY